MSQSAHETYLDTQVRTATPQKLRLMLIEGAIRFARQAIQCWDDEQHRPQRFSALARCNDIITELYSSIRADALPVAEKVKAIYQFLLVQLAQVTTQDDAKLLHEVVEVLERERETWQLLCAQMPEPPTSPDGTVPQAEEITASGMKAIAPQAQVGSSDQAPGPNRLSLEA